MPPSSAPRVPAARSVLAEALAVLAGLVLLTLLLTWTDFDHRLPLFLFDCNYYWPGERMAPWTWLYAAAAWPSMAVGSVALLCLLGSRRSARCRAMRRHVLFILLFLALGPGLVINMGFKQHWGRPRPKNIQEFGGRYAYTPPWKPGPCEGNSSFPSGHAAIAYALMGPWFVLRRGARRTGAVFLVLGIAWGSAVGLARMVQGSHFITDVIWAGGMVYVCGLVLAAVMGLPRPPPDGAAGE